MKSLLRCWFALGFLVATGFAASPRSPFTFVMIDSKTEAVYGGLPFDRALMAKAINQLAAAKAKGIVLKFFYDLPSTEDKDRALETSICAAPVALQAGLNDTEEATTNAIEQRFQIDAKPIPGLPLAGNSGFIPLRRFSKCALAIGFVDHFNGTDEIPLVELYQGKMVKSLWLVVLEMASGQKAQVEPSGRIRFADKNPPLDLMHHIRYGSTNSLSYVPMHEILGDTGKSWQPKVENTVVIIGYDGKNIHTIDTAIGPVGAHRLFIYGLLSLANQFDELGAAKLTPNQ
jgi:hypothetical protein